MHYLKNEYHIEYYAHRKELENYLILCSVISLICIHDSYYVASLIEPLVL